MLKISKHIGTGFGKGELYDILVQLQEGLLPISGETYYVSKVGNNTDGLSWETAFTTIAGAIAASNTYIALTENTGRRNRIYIDGGALWAEALVTLPNQCDMVGVGARTGWVPTIYETTTITTAVVGCHIYNMLFNNPSAGKCVVIPDASHGIRFYNCGFSGTDQTHGLTIGSVGSFTVQGCKFGGNPPAGIAITLEGPLAVGDIRDNFISATGTGIAIAQDTTTDYGLVIRDNVIFRADPNSNSPMDVGIDFQDTGGRSHACVIDNRIAAADGIQFGGVYSEHRDHWMCIGNICAVGATAPWEAPPA